MKIKLISYLALAFLLIIAAGIIAQIPPPWVDVKWTQKFNVPESIPYGTNVTAKAKFIVEAPPGYESYKMQFINVELYFWNTDLNTEPIQPLSLEFKDVSLNTEMEVEHTFNTGNPHFCSNNHLKYWIYQSNKSQNIPDKIMGYPNDEGHVDFKVNCPKPPVLPDLVPSVNYIQTTYTEGEILKFIVTVKNSGEGDASKSRLYIKKSEQLLSDVQVFPIKSGDYQVITFPWKVSCQNDNENKTAIYFMADPLDKIKESNNINNQAVIKVPCRKANKIQIPKPKNILEKELKRKNN